MDENKILNCETYYKVVEEKEEKNTDRYIEVTDFRREDYKNLFEAAEKAKSFLWKSASNNVALYLVHEGQEILQFFPGQEGENPDARQLEDQLFREERIKLSKDFPLKDENYMHFSKVMEHWDDLPWSYEVYWDIDNTMRNKKIFIHHDLGISRAKANEYFLREVENFKNKIEENLEDPGRIIMIFKGNSQFGEKYEVEEFPAIENEGLRFSQFTESRIFRSLGYGFAKRVDLKDLVRLQNIIKEKKISKTDEL